MWWGPFKGGAMCCLAVTVGGAGPVIGNKGGPCGCGLGYGLTCSSDYKGGVVPHGNYSMKWVGGDNRDREINNSTLYRVIPLLQLTLQVRPTPTFQLYGGQCSLHLSQSDA